MIALNLMYYNKDIYASAMPRIIYIKIINIVYIDNLDVRRDSFNLIYSLCLGKDDIDLTSFCVSGCSVENWEFV